MLELAVQPFAGILNVAGSDAISLHDLGVLIARRDGLEPARLLAGSVKDLRSPRPNTT